MSAAQPITFGDNVRVIAASETKKSRLSGRTGQVSGVTTPSVTNVQLIGKLKEDLAFNVYFEDQEESYWIVAELLEFVDHGTGTEITLEGIPTKWTRNAEGGWDESTTEPSEKKRGFLSRLFGLLNKYR